MTQQITTQTQSKDVGELLVKDTPFGQTDVLLVSEDGINVKQLPRHLLNPLQALMLTTTGLI